MYTSTALLTGEIRGNFLPMGYSLYSPRPMINHLTDNSWVPNQLNWVTLPIIATCGMMFSRAVSVVTPETYSVFIRWGLVDSGTN